jgi:beta-phosphoglucomutase-like phosphatase (HAD superfamily)
VSSDHIKAVLFDMDGVLIDAKEWHYEALNKALELFGHKIRRAEHLETYDGLPTRTKLKMLSRERGLPEALHSFINEIKQGYTLDHAWNLCRPRFVHEYALSRLKAEGYRIAVCSNSIRQSIEMMLGKAALMPWVDLIVSNQDVARPKPHPDMYTKAHRDFGLAPDECLVVEDNQHGIEAATAAGCHLLVVRSVDDVHYPNIRARIDSIEKATNEHLDPVGRHDGLR